MGYYDYLTDEYEKYRIKQGDTLDEIIQTIYLEEIDKLKEYNLIEPLKAIMQELLEYEKIKPDQVEFMKKNSNSRIYKIGNKVLKISKNRVTKQIPYCPEILQPLLRKELNSKNPKTNQEEKIAFIEIQEFVNTKNITSKDVKEMYQKLKSEGIYWNDLKESNLGRLIKPNEVWYTEEETEDKSTGHKIKKLINITPESAGEYNSLNIKHKILKAGDVVILDSDELYEYDKAKNDESLKYYLEEQEREFSR